MDIIGKWLLTCRLLTTSDSCQRRRSEGKTYPSAYAAGSYAKEDWNNPGDEDDC